jgi:hypothetical protein
MVALSSPNLFSERYAHVHWQRVLPWGFAIVLLLVYLPSLSGGFLVWDDPWLVLQNGLLARAGTREVWAILTDLSFSTRYTLGAEYLPLRDLSHVLESTAFGLTPQLLRFDNLILYVVAILLLREALLCTLGRKWTTELCVLIFALHPVHVESVAWIAGRKDVLALAFVAAMLWAWCREEGRLIGWSILFYAAALLSKSMSVAAIVLIVVFDLVAERRLAWRALLLLAIPAVLLMPLHWKVGSLMHMVGSPPGGTRWAAAATMGPVWWRYLECCFNPAALSIVHDVPTRTAWNAVATSGWLFVIGSGLAAARTWWRNDEPAWLAAWLTFFVPLAPVSQVFAPLQNRMADRYLWLSVLALAWIMAFLMRKLERLGMSAGVLLVLLFAASTAWRAGLFADSVSLFSDATRKTTASTVAPYLLGYALEQRKNEPAARAAYAEVLRRNGQDDATRSATNNLARLEVSRGALTEAEAILRKGIQKFPEDGKMRDNLIKVLFRKGKVEEARRLFGFPPSSSKPAAPGKPSAAPAASSAPTRRHKRRSRSQKSIRLF